MKGNFNMRYSSRNDGHLPEYRSQVKVAVLADSLRSETATQQVFENWVLMTAVATVLTTAFWLIY
jgi:hypothetical protein